MQRIQPSHLGFECIRGVAVTKNTDNDVVMMQSQTFTPCRHQFGVIANLINPNQDNIAHLGFGSILVKEIITLAGIQVAQGP